MDCRPVPRRWVLALDDTRDGRQPYTASALLHWLPGGLWDGHVQAFLIWVQACWERAAGDASAVTIGIGEARAGLGTIGKGPKTRPSAKRQDAGEKEISQDPGSFHRWREYRASVRFEAITL